MSDQHRFLSADNFYCDAYSRCQTAESMLNTAITRAEISRSFEEYLEIVGRVFAIAGRAEEARKIAEVGHCTAGFFATLLTPPWGMAFASTLTAEESFTTVELKINFFRPIWQAELKAEGTVAQRGRTIGYVECNITDEQNRLVARAASTCMVLCGQKASGR